MARTASIAARFEQALAGAGRDPSSMDRYLLLDSLGHPPVHTAAAFTEAAGRAEALGFTDVLIHWPRPSGWYAGDEASLDEIAAVLPIVQHTR